MEFSMTPTVSLGITGVYRSYFGLYQGMSAALGTTIALAPGADEQVDLYGLNYVPDPTTPGHIFVAVDTGLAPDQAANALIPDGQSIAKNNHVWIPVEITLRHKGFLAAWQEGAKEWNEADRAGKARVLSDRRRMECVCTGWSSRDWAEPQSAGHEPDPRKLPDRRQEVHRQRNFSRGDPLAGPDRLERQSVLR